MPDTEIFNALLNEQLARIIDATKAHRLSWQQSATSNNTYRLDFKDISLRLGDLRAFTTNRVILAVRYREQSSTGSFSRTIIYSSIEYPKIIELLNVIMVYLPVLASAPANVFTSVIDALSSLSD